MTIFKEIIYDTTKLYTMKKSIKDLLESIKTGYDLYENIWSWHVLKYYKDIYI